MRFSFRRLGTNARLALVAFALGLLAVFGDPFGGGAVRVNTETLAAAAGNSDEVTVAQLADWIIEQRTDYRLIDVRSPEAYAEYHIPTAENVPLIDLPDYPLARNEKIVIYSDGGTHSAQAWFLLRAKKYGGAHILKDGLDAWKNEVLFPALPEEPTPDQLAAVRRAQEVSAFFGGKPRTGGTGDVAFTMPTVEAPTAVPAGATKRKKKEGC
jgi:rhodanese-related sulfurtransferase